MVDKKEVLRWLDSWRELALLCRSVLLWQKPSYPFALLGGVTLIFIEMAYLEPRFLSVLCGVGLFALLIDYILPKICKTWWSENDWVPAKQAELDVMADSIAVSISAVKNLWQMLQQTKLHHPSVYYLTVVPTLFISGWIGAKVNNLFLTYILVTGLVMLPGLHSRGMIDKFTQTILVYCNQTLKQLTDSKKKVN